MPNQDNVLIIGDTHIPAERPEYLYFCLDIARTVKPKYVVHIGDVVDFHNVNYHEHDPDYKSVKDELELARDKLSKWSNKFPKMLICTGNHDLLVYRKAKTHGLSKEFVKSFNEIFKTPDTWRWDFEWNLDGVKYVHGTDLGGLYPHAIAMRNHRQNVVVGHTHAVAGIEYSASKKDLIWGMAVGSGVDDKVVVFDYAKTTPRRSIISCGVVINNGTKSTPIVETLPM
jgi:predicted phosphodiesterase